MLRVMIYMYIMSIIYYNCSFQRAILADNILLCDVRRRHTEKTIIKQ